MTENHIKRIILQNEIIKIKKKIYLKTLLD